MKGRAAALAVAVLVCVMPDYAQVSPTPVINNEVREADSVRMRAVQLERIKRDAGKSVKSRPLADEDAELLQIREDFEEIQKLQDEIVRVYRTSRKIDLGRIEELASNMSKRAVRLESMLFGVKLKDELAAVEVSRQVRELIIELDGAIGTFVASPIFNDSRLVDSKSAEKSQRDLALVAKLATELAKSAALGR